MIRFVTVGLFVLAGGCGSKTPPVAVGSSGPTADLRVEALEPGVARFGWRLGSGGAHRAHRGLEVLMFKLR